MNFSLFQYLLTVYFQRQRELRVRVMLAIGSVSFVSLLPFAYPNPFLTRNLNDISEVCSVLTFLMQIGILTRDVNNKLRIPAVGHLGRVAELLTLVGLGVLLTNFVDIIARVIDIQIVELLDHVIEFASLAFVVVFRFYFLGMVEGYRKVFKTQKGEIVAYLLLLTHSLPFMALDHATGLSWLHAQGMWMRVTIVICLGFTARAKYGKMSTTNEKSGTSSHTSLDAQEAKWAESRAKSAANATSIFNGNRILPKP